MTVLGAGDTRAKRLGLPIRVLKLGGSLLDWSHWPQALQHWLAGQPPANSVLIVGGGVWGDAVRQWDEHFGLGEAFCHQLCGKLLSLSAELAAKMLKQAATEWAEIERIEEYVELTRRLQSREDSTGRLVVFDAGRYLLTICPQDADPLPCDWSVTSDSIAADLACRLNADELVLLKSCDPGQQNWIDGRGQEQEVLQAKWPELASSGHVDHYFPQLAPRLRRIRWINLRGSG
ncbi:MAG: hypothetical protein U1A77_19920 [Pirellulales bacterium]